MHVSATAVGGHKKTCLAAESNLLSLRRVADLFRLRFLRPCWRTVGTLLSSSLHPLPRMCLLPRAELPKQWSRPPLSPSTPLPLPLLRRPALPAGHPIPAGPAKLPSRHFSASKESQQYRSRYPLPPASPLSPPCQEQGQAVHVAETPRPLQSSSRRSITKEEQETPQHIVPPPTLRR